MSGPRSDAGAGFTQRPAWSTLPPDVVAAVENALGAAIISTSARHGGMSPGPAAALALDDGRQVFAKAVSGRVNPRSRQLYAFEAEALSVIGPLRLRAAPRLAAVVEHGPWLVLVSTLAPGRTPGSSWSLAAVSATAAAIDEVRAHRAPAGLLPVLFHLPDLDGWEVVAAGGPGIGDAWEREHATRCAQAVVGWRHFTAGPQLVHDDVRGDNVVIDPGTGAAVLVDWAFANSGAPWHDLALLAGDVVTVGLADGDALTSALDVLTDCQPEAGRFVIGLAGMLSRNSGLPAYPSMPTFRDWQRHRALHLRPLVERLLSQLAG